MLIEDWELEMKRICCELWEGKALKEFAQYYGLDDKEVLSIIASNAQIVEK